MTTPPIGSGGGIPPSNVDTFDPVNGSPNSTGGAPILPPTGNYPPSNQDLLTILNSLPDLTAPLTAAGISLEVLVEALGSEERKTSVQTAVETLKARGDARKQAGEEKLQKIQENLEKIAKENELGLFGKIFKYIGMALGAIAAVASIAIGAATGNPLMVAGGVMLMVMTVDSIVSEATDGKYSIAAGVAEIAKSLGADEQTAQIIGLAITMVLTIAAAVMTGAAGLKSAVNTINQVAHIASKISSVVSLASGLVSVGTGAVGVASAVLKYGIEDNKASIKELEAIMEQIRQATQTEEDFLKFVMEKFNDLQTKVNDILQANVDAQAQILGGGAESMA
ncbi:MAG: type III secretion system translocon subunit SctE [Deltaproteobacteria bacterium]|jgi:hypothetical protein|nr:type III secretion system translocon subunit SctE [Deltaproteobacteria bacterium]